jgi:HPt (histidine-containing phosphotransfer) domain-containing protein
MTKVTEDLCRSESGAPCSVDQDVVVDLTTLLETAGGDRELLSELIGMFREDCPNLMEQIRNAVGGCDLPPLMSAAHTLKGLLGSLGARKAHDIAFRLENIGRGSDMTGAAEALDMMEDEIVKVDAALESIDNDEGDVRGGGKP